MTLSRRYLQEDLLAAVANDDLAAVRIALAMGADPNKPGRILVGELAPSEVPIALALRLGYTAVIRLLLAPGSEPPE